MSAFGPKRTSLVALHMSAFGGKADIALSTEADPKYRNKDGTKRGGAAARQHRLLFPVCSQAKFR